MAVSFASSIGATLVFLAARFLFRDAIQKKFGKRLKTINEGVEKDGAFYLLALRLVPVFPFWVINLVMALTPIRTWTYYWVSQLGMLPATIVYVNAGTQLGQIESTGDILSLELIGAFALLGLLPLILRWVLRMLKHRKVYAGHAKPKSFDYNLIVLGAGSAGLVSAYIGATVNAKVALIEKNKMGGDCLNTGCVPSKALLRTARLVQDARDSERFGIRAHDRRFLAGRRDAAGAEVITKIEPHDSPERYRGMGVDVIEGAGKLVSPWAVEVDGRTITARSVILATGAEPLVPPIDGLEDVEYVTSDTIWELDQLPERFAVLGGGPIGCELAQAFARLGSESHRHRNGRSPGTARGSRCQRCPDEAPRGRGRAHRHRPQGQPLRGRRSRGRKGDLRARRRGSHDRIRPRAGRAGRKARTRQGFGLEELGVQIADQGTIETDPWLRTNFPNIYVCGDAAGPYQFTHVAAHQAWFASVNALLAPFWSFRVDYRVIPWATFTEPEVARVG